MSKALSVDLRQRVVAAVRDEGLSHRAAAARFKVSAASISRWRALERQGGDLRPGPLGGDRRSGAIEAHAATIWRLFNARRDMSIEELREHDDLWGVQVFTLRPPECWAPRCRLPAPGTIARTAAGAFRRVRGCGSGGGDGPRVWSTAPAGVWQSAC